MLLHVAQSSSETSVLTRATRRNIPEDTILQLMACLYTAALQQTTDPDGHLIKTAVLGAEISNPRPLEYKTRMLICES
jgi:hypothetical protein